jgi:glycosyltransferase involved in cell wall biosynthesis
VVIPAFNEKTTISSVVTSLVPEFHVVVVDDGSTDGTGELAALAGADVVRLRENRGYDRALKAGLDRSLKCEAERIYVFDADAQFDPSTLSEFRSRLLEGADFVIGVRPNRPRVAENWFSAVSTYLWGVRDPLCGLKAFRGSALVALMPFPRFSTVATFFVFRARLHDLKIEQIQVSVRERQGESRFGKGFLPNLKITLALFVVTLEWLVRWLIKGNSYKRVSNSLS